MKVLPLKKRLLFFLFFFNLLTITYAQNTQLKGKIIDASTNEPLSGVTITIQKTTISTITNTLGVFDFKDELLPLGEQIMLISKPSYVTKRFPIVIDEGRILDLSMIDLEYDLNQEQIQIGTISLSDNELDDDDDSSSFNISGLLQASRDVYLSAAAFDFSATFFRPRGLGNEHSKVLINGLEMNKLSNGRPQWSNWGGLNDVQRNQEFFIGITANEYTFGNISGTTNIIMRASQYRKGGRVSYATSNKSYTGRIMASYSSGVKLNGWAYTVALARRYGKEGYIDGTLYDANSVFATVEKKINDSHSLNLTSFYTPNRRGKSTAITQEVYDLKGRKYNPNWGYFDGEKKNSKIREIEEPVIMLNHYWDITEKTILNTNIGFQTGKVANIRIDNGGTDLMVFDGQEVYAGAGSSADTNPMHYSFLPSNFLRDITPTSLAYQKAFLAQQRFKIDGQLDWNQLIQANQLSTLRGENAIYILYDDRNDDTQWNFNTIITSELTDNIMINAAINYRTLVSRNFAEVTDLLGGTGFMDIDSFAETADKAQSDLRNRNRVVGVGDRYDYNYTIDANEYSGFAQAQFTYHKVDFFVAGNVSKTSYQREGLFENGYFPGNSSFGKGNKIEFSNYGIKGGATLKIDGRNLINIHGAYFTKAPTIRGAFANARQNHLTIEDVTGEAQESEKIQSVDLSYNLRTPNLKARLTGYYTKTMDATDISFFFTQSLLEGDAGFIQEIVTGIDKQFFGTELGLSYQITPTIKAKAAAGIGQYTYANNPELYIAREDVITSYGPSSLQNYHLAQGPERAMQLGFEYRDPNFWWVGATTNYFSNAYIDIGPLARTTSFNQDIDGLPFNEYNDTVARDLLRQEKIDDYFLVNIIGGKSWRVKGYYIGFFATINNVLNQEYKTGGFEQSRLANYRLELEEAKRETPVFGSRYFYGYGASYYLNVYVRF